MALALASSPTTVIASAALVLAGRAVGILLGRWTSASAVIERSAEAGPPQSDIRPALTELQRTTEAILQTLRARGGTSQSSPDKQESATPVPDGLDRLAAAVETLNILLQGNGGRMLERSAAIQKWKGTGFMSLNAMWTRIHEIAGAGLEDWSDKLNSELREAHLAWTREDLFERYGAPTVISATSRGLQLGYQRKLEEESIESITFLVADDLVVYIYYEN